MSHETHIQELQQRRSKAYAMGGEERLAKRRAQGVLNARERLDALLDPGSFCESGLLATSYRPEAREKTPADGKIAGFGAITGRPVAVVSNDFTVMGASSSVVNGKKIKHVRQVAADSGMPLVLLGESAGARMPDRMGAAGRAILGQDPTEYLRDRRTPWVSALLGNCYGSSTWYACLSDFVVMRKGATMAVASSRVTELAIKQAVDAEDLGGWKLHTGTTGIVDVAVDTDEEALEVIKRFLSYLPSHSGEAPPVAPVPAGSDDAMADILDIVPESRAKTYDSREVIRRLLDTDSLFELKPRFGKSIVTGLGRIAGRTVGVLANNPKFKGGAIDVDACAKATSFLVLCDSFNIPLVFLADQPGFLIGIDGEKRGAPGRIMNWMNALSQVTVPRFVITLRKNYGQAYLNMGGGRNSDEAAAWPCADFGFMDPATAVNVLYGVRHDEDPEKFQQLVEQINQDNAPWALASLYEAKDVIDPRETRAYLKRLLAIHSRKPSGGIGAHRLACWPTSY
ncbi:acyl-CoA carboxylase subunit beta [Bordetella sp. BOR01]|uniref:acyl-CoA carboxylase subunit beta n=1 Tax=Bordetella sp. BOR01 TaxID=2854779 RepID=UPI001C43ECCC|nr:carboxyl transferase domain-containing protein [Bordetella sp. BOR01]MBV7485494.1 methylmalonyl-CoA carboxyltransferase [Bordetella sp. BOR01]